MKVVVYDNSYELGIPTGFTYNGEMVYTGDEVSILDGKLGVVIKRNGDYFEVITNKEVGKLTKKEYNFKNGLEEVANFNSIIKKYYHLKSGDVVARGRNTGIGFSVI